MVPHPRYQQKPLSLGSVALVMTASRSTISPDANRESRSHGLTHLPHGRRCSQRRGAKSRSPAVGIRLSAQHEASTKGPGTNPGHCSGTSASFSESSLNEGTGNKSRSHLNDVVRGLPRRLRLNEGTGNKSRSPVFRNFIDSKRFEASTKGPGTNPGHRDCHGRRCREQRCLNEGTGNKSRSPFAHHPLGANSPHASTKGPGTNPGHACLMMLLRKCRNSPQRRDREQIPVTYR